MKNSNEFYEQLFQSLKDYNAGKIPKSAVDKYSLEDRQRAQEYWTQKTLDYYFSGGNNSKLL